ncbi:protein SHORT ROOT IN SALT MEDIUM 1-like [Aristolochia californica]|uniref:protein SHORT ROOT IN SALT MEDIUM 1-like n=1 Tax=Aristolochia californica TaxID=171875 RepID=UPI0035DEBD7C
MYSSRGSNAYGQQSFGAQQPYGQASGTGYSGGADGSSQHSRNTSMLVSSQDVDIGGYRSHAPLEAHYGGQYSSVYAATALSGSQQIAAMGTKGVGSSLQSDSGYGSALGETPGYATGAVGSALGLQNDDYASSSKYGHKSDHFSAPKVTDYSSVDRRHYSDQPSSYIGRDLPSDQARRYVDPVGLGLSEMHDHIDQASLLRQQQMVKVQSLQAGPDLRHSLAAGTLDGGSRPADYLASRGGTIRHGPQDVSSYGRIDADPRNLHLLGSSYGGTHPSSIMGAAPRRNMDDILYGQGSTTGGYGVGLPPGRVYIAGKGFRDTSVEPDYPSGALPRSGLMSIGGTKLDERGNDRGGIRRELEIREQERRREHLRAREREKERERVREREKERKRERDREREREWERLQDRREKERERECKRGPELRRERTPPKGARDRHGSSFIREERPPRRDSPLRRDASHRRHSPVKEKRREYVCKVVPSCLVDVERDYLSISKRYPRLFISPEFSKLVVHWPNGTMSLSFHTPVSFEHELVEADDKVEKEPTTDSSAEESEKSKSRTTVWNAKVLLMSGISSTSLDELCAGKSSDDRIAHVNSILRFALLRKDRSFLAVGGPWNATIDGGDPLVDDSSLIRTALRCAKEAIQLDLQNCQHWNRFLEIHYDRVGRDGLFSHKEITVLFVPNLSECLPSLDSWRSQWLAFKKVKDEREQEVILLRREKNSNEQKDGDKGDHSKSDQEIESARVPKPEGKLKDVKEETDILDGAANQINGVKKTGEMVKDGNKDVEHNADTQQKDKGLNASEIHSETNGEGVNSVAATLKPVRKKIIRKVKVKVGEKKSNADDNSPMVQESKPLDERNGESIDKTESQTGKPESQDGSAAEAADVKTFVRKRIVRKVRGKAVQKIEKVTENDANVQKEADPQEGKTEDTKQTEVSSSAPGQDPGVKAPGKKKIIRRVVAKKKTSESEVSVVNSDKKEDGEKGNNEKTDKQVLEVKNSGMDLMAQNEGSKSGEMHAAGAKTTVSEKELKDLKGKAEVGIADIESKSEKGDADTKMDVDVQKSDKELKDSHNDKKEKAKDQKERKMKESRDESKRKLSGEPKEKIKHEEPQHPGLFLQTKWTKDSKLRSLSLSLDALLDYNDKDIEESTFELSLFAESLNEMLQYQMGCRLLAFLEKLRLRFVKKRNQRKREREENNEKGSGDKEKCSSVKESDKEGSSSVKRPKLSDDTPVKKELLPDLGIQENTNPTDDVAKPKEEDGGTKLDDESKMDDGTDDEDSEEDPEEDVEEDVDEDHNMNDASDENNEDKTSDLEVKHEVKAGDEEKSHSKNGKIDGQPNAEVEKEKQETECKKNIAATAREAVVDKELLQAFRFFDRNRVGYIKVDDMRLIIHNLGKFLSHRNVKELVQSALLESNTARDNRILYNKLVRLSDLWSASDNF